LLDDSEDLDELVAGSVLDEGFDAVVAEGFDGNDFSVAHI